MKSVDDRLCVGGLAARVGLVVDGTRGTRLLDGAITPFVTSLVGGDILETEFSTVIVDCDEAVSVWFDTSWKKKQ